jgi:hypothetical protein
MRMLSFRVFIVPLGAVCTLIALGLQDAPARADRDGAMASIRQKVNDCSQQRAADVCILSGEGDPGAR